MATNVYMEALSPTMEEGRVVKWLKRDGDPVKTGETLAEVETDKAVMDLVARADGVLRQVAAAEVRPLQSGASSRSSRHRARPSPRQQRPLPSRPRRQSLGAGSGERS